LKKEVTKNSSNKNPDPHKIYKLDPEPDPDPDPHQFADVKPKCMEYEPIFQGFEPFFKGSGAGSGSGWKVGSGSVSRSALNNKSDSGSASESASGWQVESGST
jgi:hypothetical protein